MLEQMTENQNGVPRNCDENGNVWRSIRIFDNVCLKYLSNECFMEDTLCQFVHQLPCPSKLSRNLDIADRKDVEEAHEHLLLKYERLLIECWPVFCRYYGRRNYREYLRLAIGPVSMLGTVCIEYQLLTEILNGLIISGVVYRTAIQLIINELEEVLEGDDQTQFEFVWKIIFDSRNDGIKTHLSHFATAMIRDDSNSNTDAINQLLQIQLDDDTINVRDITFNILKRCTVTTFMSINQATLTEYIWHLKVHDEKSSKVIEQRAKQLCGQLFRDEN